MHIHSYRGAYNDSEGSVDFSKDLPVESRVRLYARNLCGKCKMFRGEAMQVVNTLSSLRCQINALHNRKGTRTKISFPRQHQSGVMLRAAAHNRRAHLDKAAALMLDHGDHIAAFLDLAARHQ